LYGQITRNHASVGAHSLVADLLVLRPRAEQAGQVADDAEIHLAERGDILGLRAGLESRLRTILRHYARLSECGRSASGSASARAALKAAIQFQVQEIQAGNIIERLLAR
jgi:hypothetical protein